MMKRQNRDKGHILPTDHLPEETVCATIQIPDAREYRAALVGEVSRLGKWWNWEKGDPTDRRATEAAALWREALLTLVFECPEVLDMDYRQRGCRLEYSKDGVNWLLAFDYSKCLPADPFDPAGAEKPPNITLDNAPDVFTWWSERDTMTLDDVKQRDPFTMDELCTAVTVTLAQLAAIAGDTWEIPDGNFYQVAYALGATLWGSAAWFGIIPTPVTWAGAGVALVAGAAAFLLAEAVKTWDIVPDYIISEQDINEATCIVFGVMRQPGAGKAEFSSIDFTSMTNAPAADYFNEHWNDWLYPVFLIILSERENYTPWVDCICLDCSQFLAGSQSKHPNSGATPEISLGALWGGTAGITDDVLISASNWGKRYQADYTLPVQIPAFFAGIGYNCEIKIIGQGNLFKSNTSSNVAIANPRVTVTPWIDIGGGSLLPDSSKSQSLALANPALASMPLTSWVETVFTWNAINWNIGGFTIQFHAANANGSGGNARGGYPESGVVIEMVTFCPYEVEV